MIKNYLVERPIYNVFDYPRQTQVFEDTVSASSHIWLHLVNLQRKEYIVLQHKFLKVLTNDYDWDNGSEIRSTTNTASVHISISAPSKEIPRTSGSTSSKEVSRSTALSVCHNLWLKSIIHGFLMHILVIASVPQVVGLSITPVSPVANIRPIAPTIATGRHTGNSRTHSEQDKGAPHWKIENKNCVTIYRLLFITNLLSFSIETNGLIFLRF